MRSLKTIILASAMVAVTGIVTAQTTKQDRHLSGFNAVQLSASFDVYITQGATESVTVEAPADVIDKIVTEVDGGTLKIYNKNNTWHWSGNNKKMVIYVSIKDVNSVVLSGSGDIFFKEGLKAASLRLKVSGSGDMTGKLAVTSLEASVSGSGDMTVSGTADTSTVSVGGSGDYSGQNLVTNSTTVHVGGSGDAKVNAADKLEARASGSGDVHYTGTAKNVHTSKSGSGDVSRM